MFQFSCLKSVPIFSITVTLLIRLSGVDDPCLRQRLRISVLIKTGPAATRYPVPLNRILESFKKETAFFILQNMLRQSVYDNCRNLCALIGWFFIVNKQTDTWFYTIYAIRPRAREDNLTICYHVKNKLKSVVHASVLLLTMNFVVLGTPRLSPRGSTATLIMLWRNPWSITGPTLETWRAFVLKKGVVTCM